MPRVCQRSGLALLGMAVMMAVACLTNGMAGAQTVSDPDAYLMSPRLDGKPRVPPRFRAGTNPQTADDTPGVGRLPTFGLPAASGAGTTGFNSTNLPRKKTKRGQPAPSIAHGEPAPLPPAPAMASAPPAVATRSPAPVVSSRLPQRRGVAAISPVVTGSLGTAGYLAPLPVRRRPVPIEDDPYAQLGWRAGAFLVLPAVEFTTGYDTNPSRTPNGGGSSLFVVAPELRLRSDWVRHALNVDLRGSYTAYGSSAAFDRPDFNGKINGRLDASRDTTIDLEGRLLVATDNPGSLNVQAGLAKLPVFTDVGVSAGVTRHINRLELSAKGSVDRTVYQDSLFTDGTTASNNDRDFNAYGVKLRAGYETLPGIQPFVEVEADQRTHDRQFDRFGLQRDSTGNTGRIGSTVNLPARLTGEISVGYTTRSYKDPSLESLSGFIFDSSLVWSANALTKATLTARSAVNELVVPGLSGYLSRDYGLQVDHAFRRWLIGTVKLGTGTDTFVGSDRVDQRYSVSAGLVYKLTRTLQIKGELRRDWMQSSEPGRDYTADAVLVGLRLQR